MASTAVSNVAYAVMITTSRPGRFPLPGAGPGTPGRAARGRAPPARPRRYPPRSRRSRIPPGRRPASGGCSFRRRRRARAAPWRGCIACAPWAHLPAGRARSVRRRWREARRRGRGAPAARLVIGETLLHLVGPGAFLRGHGNGPSLEDQRLLALAQSPCDPGERVDRVLIRRNQIERTVRHWKGLLRPPARQQVPGEGFVGARAVRIQGHRLAVSGLLLLAGAVAESGAEQQPGSPIAGARGDRLPQERERG